MFDLILKNGKVVFEDGVKVVDIAVKDGKIEKIGANLGTEAEKASEIIDCTGLYILPGVIDCHVHMRTPGLTLKEDFTTGSEACAAGGVTTFLDMPNTVPATTTNEALEDKRNYAKEDSIVNFGFFFGATDNNLDEIKRAKNIAGIKAYFMPKICSVNISNPDIFEKLFEWGKKIIAVHAEDEKILAENLKKFKDSKNPAVHSLIKSPKCYYEAVKYVLHLAKKYDSHVHIVHVSTHDEVEEIKKFKNDKVTCEVTPHHLFLTEKAYDDLGNFAKIDPPLRTQEHLDALWQGIDSNVIDIIATDHAPHLASEKEKSYSEAPAGVPGVETSLALMLDMVNRGRINITKVIKLMCENPARIFGIKNKGKIVEGFDADFTIVDMGEKRRIENQKLFTKCGWSPFNGMELIGWPKITIVNGKKVFENGKIVAGDFRGTEVEFI